MPNGDYARFIELYVERKGSDRDESSGEIVSEAGQVLGEHNGIHHYTIGQRRGLGVATGRPMYVVKIEPAGRRVVVGEGQALLRKQFRVGGVNWIAVEDLHEPIRVEVKIRHQFKPAWAEVRPTSDGQRVDVEFDEPQRAVTPGQAAVFYDGDLVVGGGWIE